MDGNEISFICRGEGKKEAGKMIREGRAKRFLIQTKKEKKNGKRSQRRKFVWKYLSNKVIQKGKMLEELSAYHLRRRVHCFLGKTSSLGLSDQIGSNSPFDLITSYRKEHWNRLLFALSARDSLTRARVSFVILPIFLYSGWGLQASADMYQPYI